MSVELKSGLEDEEPLDKVASVCSLCLKNPVKYTCPRCNIAYCTVDCYRSEKHATCSESFYKECFMEGLKETTADPAEKEKMIEMLKRAEDDPALDDLEDQEDDLEDRLDNLDLDTDTDKIWDRLTEQERREFEAMVGDGRLGSLMEVWTPWWMVEVTLVQEVDDQSEKVTTVNQSEKVKIGNQSDKLTTVNQSEKVKIGNQSEKLTTVNQSEKVKDGNLSEKATLEDHSMKSKPADRPNPAKSVEKQLEIKQNTSKLSKLKIVKSKKKATKDAPQAEADNEIPGTPKLKPDIPKMSDLIKTKPSADVKYNVINILYSYVFVCRLHNGEHVSMATESAKDLADISVVLGQGHSCGSTREAIQACLTKIQSSGGNFQSAPEFDISLIKDIERLICDSDNPFPLHPVLLALSDVYEIFRTAYKACSKSLKSVKADSERDKLKKEKSDLFQCLKKCEFMLSWVQTYGMALTGLVPELDIEFSVLSGELEMVNQSKKQLEADWGGKTRPKKKALVEEL